MQFTVIPINNKEFCNFLNECDSVAIEVTLYYLEKHNFSYLKDRVKSEYSADFGVIRPLRDVWIKLLDMNPIEYVEFYEDIYRFRKVPHYEDLFITVIISIVCNLASSELYERFKVWREKNRTNNKLQDEFSKSSEVLFDYLIKIYSVREACVSGEISYEKFEEIREYLKRKIIKVDLTVLDTAVEAEFSEMWNIFAQKHLLFSLDRSIDELKDLVKLDHESLNTTNNYKKKIQSPSNSILLKAIPASSGIICGTLKIIDSIDDINKILDGDVAVFKYFTPDMIHRIKCCAGAIGMRECTCSITGHLAIMSRAIKIPCVICCNYDKFSDGQVVYLDGNKGEIRIMLSIEEIKKYLQ